MKVLKFEPGKKAEITSLIAVGSIIFFFGLAYLISGGKPFTYCYYGCVTTLHYVIGAMLALSVISMAVAFFCISYFVDMPPFKVMIWFASVFILFNTCHIGLHPMNNCQNPQGRLAFEYVVNNDVQKLSELLKTYPEAIYELSYKENTLLHQAVIYKRMEIIDLLIANHIPMNRQNISGATSYDTALGNKTTDIINSLKAHGGLPASKLPEEQKRKNNNPNETGTILHYPT